MEDLSEEEAWNLLTREQRDYLARQGLLFEYGTGLLSEFARREARIIRDAQKETVNETSSR